MTGRCGGTVAVDDQHTAMPGSSAEHELARNVIVIGNNGADQAALPEARQLDCFIQVLVREDSAHRSECLDRMHGSRGQRVFAVEQGGHEKRPFFNVGVDQVKINSVPIHDRGFARKLCNACTDLFALT